MSDRASSRVGRLSRRLALAALLVAGAAMGLAGPARSLGTARAAGGGAFSAAATSLSLALTPAVVDDDGTSVLSGQLTSDAVPVAGAALAVQSSTDGATWSEPIAVTTDTDGRFSLQVAPSPSGRTVFRAVFAGDDALAPAEAQAVLVVRAVLGAPALPRTVGRTSPFAVSGTFTPRHPAGGGLVTVGCYRLVSGVWTLRLTAAAAVADSTSGPGSVYHVAVKLPSAGTWRLRASHQDEAHAESWSPWSARLTVSRHSDAPIWNRDCVATVPERMASRLDARQLVVVTGAALGSRAGHLRVFRYHDGDWLRTMSVPARLGTNGLTDGRTRRAGTRTTPTGIWRLPGFAFGTHARGPRGLRLAWRHIGRRSWWSAEHDATYNTWVQTSRRIIGEHLADYPGPYEFAISSGFNARPNRCVYGRGTAIFLHVIHPGYSAGCVMLARADMLRLLRLLDPRARSACAIGTLQAGTQTSIRAY